ncbi:MAG: hypothetical protein AAF845_01495 [Bacteroidota bacterium]
MPISPDERPDGEPTPSASRTPDALARSEGEGPPQGKPRVGVLSDAFSLQVFLSHALKADFETVIAPTLRELAARLGPQDIDLIAADLYTLEHHAEKELGPLSARFAGVPLLIAAQEMVSHRRRATEALFSHPCTILPLPASAPTVRRMAAALVHAPDPYEDDEDADPEAG